MARRSGLGKGLGAIIPTDVADAGEATLRDVGISDVRPNPNQPRRDFDEASLAELAASIAELGVLQPILVRRTDGGGFELIAGERRWRAARSIGLDTIPAIVRGVDDERSLEQAVVENVQRDDLNPIEEALAYERLIGEFGLTQDEVAVRVGRSRPSVANTVRLLQLEPTLQGYVAKGQLSAGHARALLPLPDAQARQDLAARVLDAGMTVRDVEEAVRAGAVVDDDQTAVPGSTKPAALLELERLLADRLDTRVELKVGAKRGRIEIDFADLDDLERIFLLLS